jgi:hypothetical protein
VLSCQSQRSIRSSRSLVRTADGNGSTNEGADEHDGAELHLGGNQTSFRPDWLGDQHPARK